MQPKRFQTEWMALAFNQHKLATALKFSVIAIAVIALYFQDLSMVFTGALTNESTYHILAIPFLFGYLLYRKRKMVSATLQNNQVGRGAIQRYFSTLAGISLFAVAILTYWYGSYTFTPLEYHMLTLPFLTAALVLILFNVQTLKQLIFPIAFLVFLTPPPDELLYGAGSALANLSASASNSIANFFGLHAALSSSDVGPVITLLTPSHATLSFNVNVACSGIYSIIGFVIFAVVIAYITRGKLYNKLAILVMGIPLIMALNIVRITSILAIGYNFGEDLALQLFHYVGATVLMFIGVLILLTVTERAFKKTKSIPPCSACDPLPKSAEPFCSNCGKLLKFPRVKLNQADFAKITGIILIVIMLLFIQAPVFALTQSPPQVMIQTPLGLQVNAAASMLPDIQDYTQTYVYRDSAFEQQSGDDSALVYAYSQPNTAESTIWVAIQIAASVTSEHRWETCLINFPLAQGNPSSVRQLDLRDIQIQDNPPMTARYFAFQYKSTNQTQVVLYWYETAVFNANGTAQTKSVMISLVMYPQLTQNITSVENEMLPIAQAINNYWQPIQTWSITALALSQNGLTLSTIMTALLVALILYALFYNRQERKQLLTLYNKLSEQNKNLIKAVANAQRQGNPTTEGVATQLDKLTNMQTDRAWLKEKLAEAETVGLIEKALVNRGDKPTLAWRSLVLTKNIAFFP